MTRQSAGILPFRFASGILEVFLVHPGGPYYATKDDGVWSIAKGEIAESDDPLEAAKREFEEETGLTPTGDFTPLTPRRQSGGKIVHAWALNIEIDAKSLRSNTFTLEWPPNSGQKREFPEIDRGQWFPLKIARLKILASQAPFLIELEQILNKAG